MEERIEGVLRRKRSLFQDIVDELTLELEDVLASAELFSLFDPHTDNRPHVKRGSLVGGRSRRSCDRASASAHVGNVHAVQRGSLKQAGVPATPFNAADRAARPDCARTSRCVPLASCALSVPAGEGRQLTTELTTEPDRAASKICRPKQCVCLR